MEDEVPPTISVSSLRWSTCGDARKVALNLADDHDAVCAAKVIEASFKKFGCVCIPVSDLAVDEVRNLHAMPRASKYVLSMSQYMAKLTFLPCRVVRVFRVERNYCAASTTMQGAFSFYRR